MPAVVLARRNWRETDQIITLYTRELGRIDVLAKGVKNITGKNGSFLEPGFLIDAELIQGRDIIRLAKTSPIALFGKIRENYDKIVRLNKILFFLKENVRDGEPDIKLFDLLVEYLCASNEADENNDFSLEIFLWKFLQVSGFTPELSRCVKCDGDIKNNDLVNFSLAQGGVLCDNCSLEKNELIVGNIDFSLLNRFDQESWNFRLKQEEKELFKKSVRSLIFSFAEFVLGKNLEYLSKIG